LKQYGLQGVGATLEGVWAGTLEFQSHSRMHLSVYNVSKVVDFANSDRYPTFTFSDFNPLTNQSAKIESEQFDMVNVTKKIEALYKTVCLDKIPDLKVVEGS